MPRSTDRRPRIVRVWIGSTGKFMWSVRLVISGWNQVVTPIEHRRNNLALAYCIQQNIKEEKYGKD